MSVNRSIQAIFLTDENGNTVGVVLDGSVYRLQSIGKIVNASGTTINPATEETITAIKDTDGIKKITDALPTGTNIIGKALVTDIDGDMAVKDGDGHPEMHITGDSLSFSLEMIRRELAQIRMLTEYSLDASFREAEDDD